jgi:cytochrome c556
MYRIAVLVLASLGIAAAAAAQNNPVDARRDLMKAAGAHVYEALPRMVRGEDPYDQAKVDAAFAQLSDAAAKLTGLFPENSVKGSASSRYAASPRIWENRSEFEVRLAAFAKAVAEGRAKATSREGLSTVHPVVNNSCTDCHRAYRVRVN